ncbi:HEPN domain-containing protein [Faecalimonas umbilicata]|nr:HEPN domain-containing protein [Faecalimonas umbilicata]
MDGSVKDLSKYRFENAKEDLASAKVLLDDGKLKASVNRSYYAIFHTLRSVTALDQFDSSKHSGIIAYFNRTYVKEQIFDKNISKMIDTAFRLREKADYQDFVIISKDQAQEQLDKAEKIMEMVLPYLEEQWEK